MLTAKKNIAVFCAKSKIILSNKTDNEFTL